MNTKGKPRQTRKHHKARSVASTSPIGKLGNTRHPTKFITFMTDFGFGDTYVGVMKGVVADINPEARTIDLCHGVAPQDVRGAALLLAGSFAYFPAGTIHVTVVDPTVGSRRRALCVQAGEYFFVGPDNGVISVACYRAGRPKIFVLENKKYFLKKQSQTFHGRDIFAPVAAYLSTGVPAESFGRKVRSMKRLSLPMPVAERGRRLRGEIVHVDMFGNLITNIERDSIRNTFSKVDERDLIVTCAGRQVCGLSNTYSDAAPGTTVALFGSYGLLEIAVRNGDASVTLGAKQGDAVSFELTKK